MYWIIRRRQIVLCGLACLAIVAGAVGLGVSGRRAAVAAAGKAGNWGLSFPQEGQPPVGNASTQQLAAYDAHFLGDTGQKTIYLTFDAGYENGHTAKIMDALKKHGVHATFFVVGHYLDTAPDLVRRMVAEGHTVGNHTEHHPDMSAIATLESFKKELDGVERKYAELIGQPMKKLYRPPQGKYSEQNLAMAKELGYHTFFWSLAYVDWYADKQPSADEAFGKLIPRIHPGAIVLLHSTSATNADILDELLTKWENLGYTFGELSALTGA